MDIEALENTTFAAIVEKIQKVRKRSELLESIQGILRENFESVEALHETECKKIRNIIEGIPGELIGNTREMREVSKLVRQIAPTNATVLIRGRAGTGKEYVARSIHELSERREFPFIALNCDALTEGANSFESELFGFERGAFTGATNRHIGKAEQANGGTLFLDEIADLSISSQVKLLQFIQEQSFRRLGSNIVQPSNVRLIASTGKNLETMMQQGSFREDLYYRLNIFQISLPELVQRKTDILLLADHFIEKMNLKYGKKILRLSTPAIDMLMSYHWPGNVRELENCIEHACLATTDVCINAYDLPPTLQTDVTSGTSVLPEGNSPLTTLMDSYEREILSEALRRHDGNMSAAGRDLSVSPRMMLYKIRRLGLAASN
ncbi:MAG: sigma-54-dependent Fis family transcriptional regulator [Fibrobacter sp.]|nr:sigma-54-dependent Fis family transcriptional regulator [Fibrobacter sp.]MBQ5462559.1 sigma-54-dependent Fis family transcriptional regulator [Fibrobacter sp.]